MTKALPGHWPTGIVALLYGVTRGTAYLWATQGILGPVIPARRGRSIFVLQSEVEARCGKVSDEHLAEAWRRYENGEHRTSSASSKGGAS
jgi:hypothetical protein